jgi:hypothetical protein
MRSALYYPSTVIESESLLKTSLLLWDHVHIMVPWDGFRPPYSHPEQAEAVELIGVLRVPSDEEKRDAHSLVEDFATRPLPEAFSYKQKDSSYDWPVYSQKLLPDFQNSKVVGDVKDAKVVSNTQQLRIQKEVAQQTGREHQIVTGTNTRVTLNAAQGTRVIRRKDLGPLE